MVAGNGNARRDQRKGKTIAKAACGRRCVYLLHHAMQRMKQRKIAEREMFNALNEPNETGLPTPAFRNRQHHVGIAASGPRSTSFLSYSTITSGSSLYLTRFATMIRRRLKFA